VRPERYLPLLVAPRVCVSCGAEAVRALHVYPVNHGKPRVTQQLSLALLGCERCGFVFSTPTPTTAELDAYYGSKGEGWDGRIAVEPERMAAKLERKRASNALDYALLAANAELPAGRRRALDFGCGIGGWLDVLAADGWETAGIEPGMLAAAAVRTRHTLLDEIPAEPSFELVVVQHTLEHLSNPRETLSRLAAATVPGGLIYVSVPNLPRLPEHGDFDYIASDKHISSFTQTSLGALFALTGFELIAHSNDPSWKEPVQRPEGLKRLAAIGRRVAVEVALPAEPLNCALGALREHAARQPEPEPRLPVTTSRRILRRIRRFFP
jgi:2-polyprenyl-3-methyl-5-hydroxy-6-metoxy-1,4-benzoquinol methylase